MIYEVRSLLKLTNNLYGTNVTVHFGTILNVVGPFVMLSPRNKRDVYVEHKTALALYNAVYNLNKQCEYVNLNPKHNALKKIKMTCEKARTHKRWFIKHIDCVEDLNAFFTERAKHWPKKGHGITRQQQLAASFADVSQLPEKVIAIDFEMYEFKKHEVLEVGYTRLNPVTHEIRETIHIVITDYLHRHNGVYVPDNRDVFQFGESILMSKRQASKHLTSVLNECDAILTHGGNGADDKAMDDLLCGRYEVDRWLQYNTDHLSFALTGNNRQYKLCNLAKMYNVESEHVAFHNAGNDAHITAQTFLNMLNVLKQADKQVA